MRRWLFSFLLLVVPFQLVWGSATPYCTHEASASAKKHFGHHEHKHDVGGEIVSATDASFDGAGADHADCESCHLGCSAVIPSMAPALETLPDDGAASQREPRYDSHIPAGPQRPDRADAAPAARPGGGVVVVPLAD